MESTNNIEENKIGSQPTKNTKENFPPGFEHVEEIVREGKQRIKDIDAQINGLKGEKGPSPQYNPPGFIRPRPAVSKEQQETLLKQQKEQVQGEIWGKVNDEAEKTDPDTAKAIRTKTLEEVYPDLKKNERDAAKLDISQDFMNDQVNRHLERAAEKQNPQSEKASENKSDPSYSMSFKFSQTLSYPTDPGGGGGSSSTGKKKDDPEPDKT